MKYNLIFNVIYTYEMSEINFTNMHGRFGTYYFNHLESILFSSNSNTLYEAHLITSYRHNKTNEPQLCN